MNGDGRKDILISSFSGVPQWVENTESGWGESADVLDQNGDAVVIGDFWNHDTDEWDETDRSGTKGHCTSVAAVDWDGDGDMDLLLGDYDKAGRLHVRLNEGSAKETRFAIKNFPIKVGQELVSIEGGVGAPRVADWNGDGLFDILVGAIRGGVYLLQNTGAKGSPKFDELATLIEPLPGDSGAKKVKRVQMKDGQPIGPGSSFHIEPVDYDGDGDLDLLVGARSEWLTAAIKKPTKESKQQVAKLKEQMDAAWDTFRDYKATAETKEEEKELAKTRKYRELLAEYHRIRRERYALTKDPTKLGDLIWLFRRK